LYWDDSKIPGGSQNLDGCWPDTLNKRGCHGWKRTNADSISRSLPPVNPPGFGDNKTVNTWWYATADLDTIPIKVPTPFPVIIASDRKYGDVDTAVICLRSKLVLDPKFTEDTVNYSFLWYTETGDVVSTERNPVFYNIKDNSKYYVKITDNETNCISIDTYLFRVKELFVPNIITPNEDAKNDFFIIKDLIPNSKLEVFNRWGKLIYENDNYDNSWAGNDLNDGIYYYRLETPGSCGTFKGWVHIVR
jgi:gliding motility-associated-like protein